MRLDVQGYEKLVKLLGPLGAKLHVALHDSSQCAPPDPANSTENAKPAWRLYFVYSAYTWSQHANEKEPTRYTVTIYKLFNIHGRFPFSEATRPSNTAPKPRQRHRLLLPLWGLSCSVAEGINEASVKAQLELPWPNKGAELYVVVHIFHPPTYLYTARPPHQPCARVACNLASKASNSLPSPRWLQPCLPSPRCLQPWASVRDQDHEFFSLSKTATICAPLRRVETQVGVSEHTIFSCVFSWRRCDIWTFYWHVEKIQVAILAIKPHLKEHIYLRPVEYTWIMTRLYLTIFIYMPCNTASHIPCSAKARTLHGSPLHCADPRAHCMPHLHDAYWVCKTKSRLKKSNRMKT